jgi:hypothetical protein
MQELTPDIVEIMDSLARPRRNDDLAAADSKKIKRRVVLGLAALTNTAPECVNALQSIISLYMYAYNTPE